MIKMKTKIIAILLVLVVAFALPIPALACSSSYFSWTWNSGTSSLSVQLFPSAYNFYDLVYDNYTQWNSISTKVGINGFTYYTNGANQGKDIEVIGAALSGDTTGVTDIYSKNILGVFTYQNIGSYTGKVSKVIISIDTSGNFTGMTSARQKKTVIHEFGHSLALAHPSCTNSALMHQNSHANVSLSITTHDKDNLKAKWGN